MLCEKIVYTKEYAGTIDLLTGFEDFESNIDFDEEFHIYRLNGKIIPSVTQLLDDGEYQKVDEKILEYAQKKGTIVHQEIQDYLEHSKEGFTREFYEFLRLLHQESEKFKEKAIFDYKTYAIASPKKRRKCYEQEKMYAKAVKEMTGKEVEHLYLVHLPHNNKGRIYDLKEEFENDN